MKPRKKRQPFLFEEGKEKILLQKLETYCAYTERCTADVVKKLWEWKVPEQLHDSLLTHLHENRFLDDKRYATAFAEGKFRMKGWGFNKIRAGLRAKCMQEDTIHEALEQVKEEGYKEKLFALMEKKSATLKETHPQQRKAKLFRYGVQKGYEAALVLEWLKQNHGTYEECNMEE